MITVLLQFIGAVIVMAILTIGRLVFGAAKHSSP